MQQNRMIPSQAELDKMLQEKIAFLQSLSIPVSENISPHLKLNTRAKWRLGCCIKKEDSFTIELSAICFDSEAFADTVVDLPEQTLLHEILHTCAGCTNHGKVWKYYASIVNHHTSYQISRTLKRKQSEAEAYPFILLCEKCHRQIGRKKCTKVILNPHLYRCTCGGKLVRIK